ncbi:hypothetical protein K438DRAFT_1780212 [Mycena galopus ATCC 62051]|nr:hypothetical protein K438DRAFT_1780212 [Mycena galopus ATCC 62051]
MHRCAGRCTPNDAIPIPAPSTSRPQSYTCKPLDRRRTPSNAVPNDLPCSSPPSSNPNSLGVSGDAAHVRPFIPPATVWGSCKITLYTAEIMRARAYLEIAAIYHITSAPSRFASLNAETMILWTSNQEAVSIIVRVDLKYNMHGHEHSKEGFWPRRALDTVAMLVYFEIRLEFKSGFIIEAELDIMLSALQVASHLVLQLLRFYFDMPLDQVLTCASYYPIISLSFTAGSVALLPSQTLPSASRPFTHNKICSHAAPSPFSQILSSSFTALTCTCVPPIREAVLLRRFQGLPKFVSLFFPSRATDWNAYISGTYGFWFYNFLKTLLSQCDAAADLWPTIGLFLIGMPLYCPTLRITMVSTTQFTL